MVARADCPICSDISSSETFDEMAGSGAPSGLHKTGDRWRCPQCGSTYRVESESDPHHFMSAKTTVTRIK
ncbi:MAG: hypothetical protein V3R73_07945 [Sphingomonadales bacterium]